MRISWGRSHTKGSHPPPSQSANAFSAQGPSAYNSNPYAMPTAYNQYDPSTFNYAAYAANPYGNAASSLYGNNAAQDPYLVSMVGAGVGWFACSGHRARDRCFCTAIHMLHRE